MAESEPRALGSRYELLAPVGRGATGQVWRARDRRTDEIRAAKLLREEHADDPEIVTRFIRERSILLGLVHPRIVRVHDLVVEGDDLAIVMDLVEGPSLRERLRDLGTLSPASAVAVTASVLDALAAAHAAAFVHRDVKPDNVLVTDVSGEPGADDVLLTDFGIARLTGDTVMATGLLGTPGYMPPELFTEGSTSAATDVYATGILLYELLAGRTPYAGSGTAHTIGNRHVTAVPPRLPVPDVLWDALASMLEKDPRRRPAAAAAADRLRGLAPTVADLDALTPQRDPDRWEDADQELATNLHAAGPVTVGPRLDDGVPVALHGAGASGPAGDEDENATRLGRASDYRRVELAPAAPEPDPVDPRRRWLIGAGVVAGLALIGGAAFGATRLLGGEDEAQAAPASTAPAAVAAAAAQARVDLDPAETGLRIALIAAAEPGADAVSLEVQLEADDTPLGGEFLISLPPLGDARDCPGVVWVDDVGVRNVPATTGVADSCAYVLTPGTIPERGTAVAAASVSLDLEGAAGPDGDARTVLEDYLAAAADATRDDLDGLSNAGFPAQRLTAVRIESPRVLQLGRDDGAVPISLVGEYGDFEDAANPFFRSPGTRTATGVVDAVAGGLDGIRFETCDDLTLSRDRRVIGVRSASQECRIGVEVGELEAETYLSIDTAGG